MIRGLFSRLAALIFRRRAERDLEDEVRFHLDTLAEEYQRKGVSAEEARRAARRDFGGVAQVKEAYRERLGIPFVETMVQDLRYGLRALRKSPGFTAAAVVSLALGIGANTAIFSVFNALMLRTLPVREPGQLVSLYRVGGWGRGFTSYPLYLELRKQADVFDGILARSAPSRVRCSTAESTDHPEFLYREYVSANYFEVLGVRPALGRVFAGADGKRGAEQYAVVSYDFWRARLRGDASVLGKRIVIDEQPLIVVGVAQKGFRGVQVEGRADAWVPMTMQRAPFQEVGFHWLWLLARPRPGISHAQVQAKTDVVVRQFLNSNYGRKADTPWGRQALQEHLEVRPGAIGISMLRDQFAKPLALLMAVVVLILLIACANLANLLLARGSSRRREIAMRLSLGASRARLIRQWLTETSILGALGMLAGVGLGVLGSRAMLRILPGTEPLPLDVKPDLQVLLFTAAVSLAAVLLFGLPPALRCTDIQPGPVLKEGAAGGRPGLRNRLRKALLITQVALSVVLVFGAVLFSRSLSALKAVDLGFRNDDVLSFMLDYPRSYRGRQIDGIRERLVDRAGMLPGVASVTYGLPGPYQGGMWTAGIRVPGSGRTAQGPASVELQGVGPRYFETIGSPPVRGRDFGDGDRALWRKLAIVNEAFAREFLNGSNPVGRILSFDDKEPRGGEPVYIIGQVRDMLHNGVRERPVATVYLPAGQTETGSDPVILIRAVAGFEGLVPALRRQVAALDRAVTITDLRTVRQRVDDSIYLDRLISMVSGFFAFLALVLAGVGLYGVISYLVVERTPEIGIRVALGAEPGQMLWMVMREALLLIVAGAAVGTPLAIAGARVVSALLFGITPGNPAILVASLSFLLLVGGAGAALPARRAARVAPMEALRRE